MIASNPAPQSTAKFDLSHNVIDGGGGTNGNASKLKGTIGLDRIAERYRDGCIDMMARWRALT